MRYATLLTILLLAFGAAQVFHTGFTASQALLPPTISGPSATEECRMNNYVFVSNTFSSPTTTGGASFELEVYDMQTAQTRAFTNLPSHINYYWDEGEAGSYKLRGYSVSSSGAKSSPGPWKVVAVAQRTSTGRDCPYYPFQFGMASFSSRSAAVSFSDGAVSPSTNHIDAASTATSFRFRFKEEGDATDYVYNGIVGIGLGFILVALYYFELIRR